MSADSRGLDVYHKNGIIDWSAVATAGSAFAIAKATEGIHFTDDQFPSNWAGIKGIRIARGAYHFFRPSVDPEQQARHFFDVVGLLDPEDLPPVLDVEVGGGLSADIILDRLAVCLKTTETLFRRRPLIYTYPWFWETQLNNSPRSSDYPLWIANYTTRRAPRLPGGWKTWLLWQYSATGKIGGVQPPVDLDRSNGPITSLLRPSLPA